MKILKRSAVVFGLLSTCFLGLVFPCNPGFPDARFWFVRRPGVTLSEYLSGTLGVLDPKNRDAYHYVAYRYLSGAGLNQKAQENLESHWATLYDRRPSTYITHYVPGVEPRRSVNPTKRIEVQSGNYTYHDYYPNCLTDAFETAEKTLKDRARRFGRDSAEVRQLILAQQQVFANCSGEETIPAPPNTDWHPLARADRQYQIAAAHFYAGNFEEAAKRFHEISQDRDSPWSAVSSYLVARSNIRWASVGSGPRAELLEAAENQLRSLLDDPTRSGIRPAAIRLLNLVRFRTDPEGRRQELANKLAGPEIETLEMIDYFQLVKRTQGADEMSDWLRILWDKSAESEDRALDGWLQKGTLPWLVLASMKISKNRAEVVDILESAAEVGPKSPAFLTLRYHRARLLMERDENEAARRELDQLLGEPDIGLSLSDRNRFLTLRQKLAVGWKELLHFAQLVPVEVGHNVGHRDDPYFGSSHDGLEALRDGRPLFGQAATEVIDRFFTPALLLKALGEVDLPKHLRRKLALAAWTRAVLTDDDDVALQLVPLVLEVAPELKEELRAFQSASSKEEREFSSALTLLRFPGLNHAVQPTVGRLTPLGQIDQYRANWWCGVWPRQESAKLTMAFLTADQQQHAEEMTETLAAVGPGPTYLGQIVLTWARSNPDDERVPEALHRVVAATRYGCRHTTSGDVDFGEVSMGAFQMLHQRYRHSPWTAKTKYWYR